MYQPNANMSTTWRAARVVIAALLGDRLVARGGLGQATVRGIARETGVSTGSVTHYFEDKAEIIRAVLPVDASRVDTWRARMAFWPEEYGASSEGGFTDGYREWRELIARALAEAAADGELPAGLNYRHEADRLGTLLAGLGLLSGTDLATSPGSTTGRRMVDEHLASLTGQGPDPGRGLLCRGS